MNNKWTSATIPKASPVGHGFLGDGINCALHILVIGISDRGDFRA